MTPYLIHLNSVNRIAHSFALSVSYSYDAPVHGELLIQAAIGLLALGSRRDGGSVQLPTHPVIVQTMQHSVAEILYWNDLLTKFVRIQ